MEATAWNPGNLMVGIAIHKNPSVSTVNAIESSRGLLREVAVSDNRLGKMNPINDLQPLANIHNTLLQIGGLISLEQHLYEALQDIRLRLQELQIYIEDDIGQAAAEVHDFICFVTFVNLIHPQNCILTPSRMPRPLPLRSRFQRPVRRLSNSAKLTNCRLPFRGTV